jgi:hypothetical protein
MTIKLCAFLFFSLLVLCVYIKHNVHLSHLYSISWNTSESKALSSLKKQNQRMCVCVYRREFVLRNWLMQLWKLKVQNPPPIVAGHAEYLREPKLQMESTGSHGEFVLKWRERAYAFNWFDEDHLHFGE